MDKFMNEVFAREKLMAELDLPDNIFLLAYTGDEVAGYARMCDKHIPETSLGTQNVIEIARIYTASDEIGKGVPLHHHLSSIVPRIAHLAATSNVGVRHDRTAIQQGQSGSTESDWQWVSI